MTLSLLRTSNGDLTPRDNGHKAEISRIINTFRKRQFLGGGVDAVVQLISDGTARLARKEFDVRDRDKKRSMCREREAYIRLNRFAQLEGRVPKFHFSHGRCLYMEHIDGQVIGHPLVNLQMSFTQLQQAKGILKRSLEMLHNSGIAHGDVNTGNIIVRPSFWMAETPQDTDLVLIDFSRAIFQGGTRRWEDKKQYDFDGLECVFAIAHEALSTQKALAMIQRPIESSTDQLELALVIAQSDPVRELERFIRAMKRPAAILVLALIRSLSRCQIERAADLAVWYLEHPASSEACADEPSIIRIKTEKADLQSHGRVNDALVAAVHDCIHVLGRTHPYTINIRTTCALRLFQARNPAVIEWFRTLQTDLRSAALETCNQTVLHPLDKPIDIECDRLWVAECLQDMGNWTPEPSDDGSKSIARSCSIQSNEVLTPPESRCASPLIGTTDHYHTEHNTSTVTEATANGAHIDLTNERIAQPRVSAPPRSRSPLTGDGSVLPCLSTNSQLEVEHTLESTATSWRSRLRKRPDKIG